MNTQADKTQENKSQSVANSEAQKQSSGGSTIQFIDNRHESITQRKLQGMTDNSLHVSQLRAFQNMTNNSPQAEHTAQLQSMAFNSSAQQKHPIQKKGTKESKPQEKQVSSAQMKAGIVQKKDVVEDIALEGYKKDKKKIKADLAKCIDKFKDAITAAFATLDETYQQLSAIKKQGGTPDKDEVSAYNEASETLNEEMSEDGRDAFFYRSVFKKYKGGLMGDLNRFDENWHVANTGGLLADIGLALKRVPMEIFQGGLSFDEIMPEYQQEGSDHVRGRGPVRSDWADDLEYSQLKGNAGPSSTTTQLLHVVSSIGGFSNTEVEAMMIALVKFWKGKTKRTFGKGHHTAVEVWAPYTGYLEAQKGGEDESAQDSV